LNKRRNEVREGRFFPEKMRRRLHIFEEAAKDFLAWSKQNRRDHRHNESRSSVLLELWRNVPLEELTAGRIQHDLSVQAQEQEWTPATSNRYRALLSKIFSHAIKAEKATTNPVRGTEHLEENNERVRFLSDEEEARLIAKAREMAPDLEPKIVVALHSGMRRSEQFRTDDCKDGGLKWEHVNFQVGEHGMITLPRSKHGKSRHIPMNSTLERKLKKIRSATVGSAYVFPGPAPDRLFPQIVEEAEIEDFKWHDLRHTYASRLSMAGVDIRWVQELMGHRAIATTLRYSHLSTARLSEAVEKLVNRTGKTDPATDPATFQVRKMGRRKLSQAV
jgi:site-specific recombinase XerD